MLGVELRRKTYVTFLDSNASRVNVRVKVLCIVRPIALRVLLDGADSSSQSCHQSDPILIGQVVNGTSLQERSDCSDTSTFLNASFVCSSRALRVSCSSRSPSSYGRNSKFQTTLSSRILYALLALRQLRLGLGPTPSPYRRVGCSSRIKFHRSSVLFGLRGDVRYLVTICPSYKPTESDSGKSLIV